jgi:hypothetical protein
MPDKEVVGSDDGTCPGSDGSEVCNEGLSVGEVVGSVDGGYDGVYTGSDGFVVVSDDGSDNFNKNLCKFCRIPVSSNRFAYDCKSVRGEIYIDNGIIIPPGSMEICLRTPV